MYSINLRDDFFLPNDDATTSLVDSKYDFVAEDPAWLRTDLNDPDFVEFFGNNAYAIKNAARLCAVCVPK